MGGGVSIRVCDTNKYGEIVDVMEKPEDPPSNLVMTGFYTFTPAIFHACHLVQPSDRGEYEISEAIDLLLQSGRTIDAIGLDGWRIDVGYPADRDEAERRLESDDWEDAEATSDCCPDPSASTVPIHSLACAHSVSTGFRFEDILSRDNCRANRGRTLNIRSFRIPLTAHPTVSSVLGSAVFERYIYPTHSTQLGV